MVKLRNESPTLGLFLEAANGAGMHRARTRLFGASNHAALLDAVERAREYRKNGEAFYETDDAGSVASSYGYSAYTAQWTVWIDPVEYDIVVVVQRVRCNGRHVTCARHGGERQYLHDWGTMRDTMRAAVV